MTASLNILAEGPGKDLTDFIFPLAIIAIVVLMKILSSVLQKKQGGEERQRQQERWDDIRRQRAERLQREQAGQQARPATSAPPAARPTAVAPQTVQPSPKVDAAQPLEPARTVPQAQPVLQPARRRPPKAPLQPAGQALQHLEVSHDMGHLPELDASLAGKRPAGKRAAATARAPAPAPARELPPVGAVGPLDAERARQAIIYHEILSTPKALRQGGEMWDL